MEESGGLRKWKVKVNFTVTILARYIKEGHEGKSGKNEHVEASPSTDWGANPFVVPR